MKLLIIIALLLTACSKDEECRTCYQTVTWTHSLGLYEPTSYTVEIKDCENDTLSPQYSTQYSTPTGMVTNEVVNVCR